MRHVLSMRPAAVAAFMIALGAVPAAAQQTAGEVHGNYQRGTSSDANSWGAGAALQMTYGPQTAPVRLSTTLGADYLKQENSGPSATSLSLDVTVQPGGSSAITPYAGGSISSNWSGGDDKAYDGARFGTEVLGGVQVKLEKQGSVSLKAEERFGYVNGQEHTLTTRFGVMMSF